MGETSAQKLLKSNLSLNDLPLKSASQIDLVMGRQNSAFGSSILDEISDVPVFQIELSLLLPTGLNPKNTLSKVLVRTSLCIHVKKQFVSNDVHF